MELAAQSVRSGLASASGSSSGLAFGFQLFIQPEIEQWLTDFKKGNG
jgi:hypothetical protein